MSPDGLFRVSPTNKYYYESYNDQTELSMFVQASSSSSERPQSFGRGLLNLTLMDCNAHKSCVSCLSVSSCEWCGNKCANPSEEVSSRSECDREASRCASFDTGTTKLLIPFTAHRQQAPLLFSLANVAASSTSAFQCMFTLFNGRMLPASTTTARNLTVPYLSHNASHASCQLGNVFNVLASLIESYDGQIQTNLRLYDPTNDVFVDSSSNGKLALLFYKCEIKASDCGQCLGVNPQLSCMWCQQIPAANAQSAVITASKANCR